MSSYKLIYAVAYTNGDNILHLKTMWPLQISAKELSY